MATEIYVISGFLGAGKTTLIHKLIHEAFVQKKMVLIENDFGEISVDAALLKSGGVEVKEMNSGCICCSLSGDLVKAVDEILDRFHPDIIIIEPSGVGKLSDVVKACSDLRISSRAKVKKSITVVDVKRCNMYLQNFGEFFEDQIDNADVIVLSHTEEYPDWVSRAVALMHELNPHLPVISKAWDQIGADEILPSVQACHEHEHACCCHGEHGDCCHHHDAEEVFKTVTIRTEKKFTTEQLRMCMEALPETVLRAKGILHGTDGFLNVQYLPGDLQIERCEAKGDMLCVIGTDLSKPALVQLFGGE